MQKLLFTVFSLEQYQPKTLAQLSNKHFPSVHLHARQIISWQGHSKRSADAKLVGRAPILSLEHHSQPYL